MKFERPFLKKLAVPLSLLGLAVLLLTRFAAEYDLRYVRPEIYALFSLSLLFILFILRHEPKSLLHWDPLCALLGLILSGSVFVSYFIIVHMLPYTPVQSGLCYLLLSLFFYLLFFSLKCFCLSPSPLQPAGRSPSPKAMLLLAAVFALCLALPYLNFFPYGTTPDSTNQWQQLHGELPYNTVHSIGHTLFLGLLLKLWDDYTIVILVQLLAVTGLYLLFARYFYRRGISLPVILISFAAALILIPAASNSAFFYPWKDTPAAICLCLVTYLLLRYRETDELSLPGAALLGLLLSLNFMFRLNGIVLLLIIGGYFSIILLRRRQIRQLTLMLTLILSSQLALQLYTDRVVKPARYDNGFSIQVFGSGIASMVESGELSEEELAEVDAILDLDWMQRMYSRYERTRLIWTGDNCRQIQDTPELALFNNAFVLDLGAHRSEVIRLYFKLLPRHPIPCIKDVVGSLFMMWRVSLNFAVCYLFQLFLLLFLCIRLGLKRPDWIIFLPSACNTLSIMISTVTGETRYLLPFFMLMPVYLLYLLVKHRDYAAADREAS